MTRKENKLILIRKDLLEKAIKITAKEGRTMLSFTNEIFEQALRAYEMGVIPKEIVDFYALLKLGKNTGAVALPKDILNYMIDIAYKVDEDNVLKKWYESGVWIGKYLSVIFGEEDETSILRKIIKMYIWDITDFSVQMRNDKIEIRCASPILTTEHTKMLAKFLEGILNTLNFRLLKNECLKGIILMVAEKK